MAADLQSSSDILPAFHQGPHLSLSAKFSTSTVEFLPVKIYIFARSSAQPVSGGRSPNF
jgi:hypothetical protein